MIKPLHDRVVIRRRSADVTTSGGIVLPGAATEKPNEGEVIAVGAGRLVADGRVVPLAVKPGDVVLFGQYGANKISIDGEDYLILNESELYGVIERNCK